MVHTQGKNTDTLTFMYILLNAMMYSDGFLEKGLAFDTGFQKISFLIRRKNNCCTITLFPHIDLYDFYYKVYRENGAAIILPVLA